MKHANLFPEIHGHDKIIGTPRTVVSDTVIHPISYNECIYCSEGFVRDGGTGGLEPAVATPKFRRGAFPLWIMWREFAF